MQIIVVVETAQARRKDVIGAQLHRLAPAALLLYQAILQQYAFAITRIANCTVRTKAQNPGNQLMIIHYSAIDFTVTCSSATKCEECSTYGCYWCPDSTQPCSPNFDEFQCCSDCTICEQKRIFGVRLVLLHSLC